MTLCGRTGIFCCHLEASATDWFHRWTHTQHTFSLVQNKSNFNSENWKETKKKETAKMSDSNETVEIDAKIAELMPVLPQSNKGKMHVHRVPQSIYHSRTVGVNSLFIISVNIQLTPSITTGNRESVKNYSGNVVSMHFKFSGCLCFSVRVTRTWIYIHIFHADKRDSWQCRNVNNGFVKHEPVSISIRFVFVQSNYCGAVHQVRSFLS